MKELIYKFVENERELEGAYEVRRQVFVEEQGISEDLVFIGNKSTEEMNMVVMDGEMVIGTARVQLMANNIAKIERYTIGGKKLTLCVHRKGATRAFPAGHPDIPSVYRNIGQPVLIPGDMGRCSYIAVGTEMAMKQSFGSTCHGAGRLQSRAAAKRSLRGADVAKALAARGIMVKASSMGSLAEEASEAYKDVTDVVEVTHKAGISRKVARAVPIGVIKG